MDTSFWVIGLAMALTVLVLVLFFVLAFKKGQEALARIEAEEAEARVLAGTAAPGDGMPVRIRCPRCSTMMEMLRGLEPAEKECPSCRARLRLSPMKAAEWRAWKARRSAPVPAPPGTAEGATGQARCPRCGSSAVLDFGTGERKCLSCRKVFVREAGGAGATSPGAPPGRHPPP